MAAHPHGTPCWIDMGVADIDKAVAFYSTLLGWDIPEANEEMGGYRLSTLDGKAVAGLSAMQETPHPYWTTYISVDDIEATSAAATQAGGSVLLPAMDVMDLGKMAIIADPVGAALGLWQAGTFAGVETHGEPGSWCWPELLTTDTDAAEAFYTSVFGWTAESSAGDMPYTEWKVGDRSVGGMMAKPPTVPAEVPPFWCAYFSVADLDGSIDRAKELGAVTLADVVPSPAGRLVPMADPTAAAFCLITLELDGHE